MTLVNLEDISPTHTEPDELERLKHSAYEAIVQLGVLYDCEVAALLYNMFASLANRLAVAEGNWVTPSSPIITKSL